MNSILSKYLFQLSAIALLVSLIVRLYYQEIGNYIFAFSSAGIAITRTSNRYEGTNFRLKRLYRMEMIAGFLLVGASYFMFRNRTEWILMVSIAAFLQLYAAIIIPRIKHS